MSMTREEAKDYIREWCPYDRQEEIIKALEQEPCEDAINRQAAIDAVNIGNLHPGIVGALQSILADLPPVTPKQEPCEDAISRQAALEIFGYVMDYWREHAIDVEPHEIKDALIEQYEFTAKQLSELPPVTPQPKWIPVSERLPDEFQRVLVTIVNYNGDNLVRVAEYYNRRGVGVFQIKENHEQWEVGEKGLLAWMSLPDPYKAESEEEK